MAASDIFSSSIKENRPADSEEKTPINSPTEKATACVSYMSAKSEMSRTVVLGKQRNFASNEIAGNTTARQNHRKPDATTSTALR